MKRNKKLLSLLLALALVLTAVPFSGISVGAYDAPLLNSDGYYEISTADHLYWFAEQVKSGNNAINGVLMNDIVVNEGDLSGYDGTSDNEWRKWTPIGNESNYFEGTFDGCNHIVSGLYFNDMDFYDSSTFDMGLFFFVTGTIKNLGVTNSYFHAKFVGGIAAFNQGEIINCFNEGTIIGDSFGHAGGICSASAGKITECYNNGNIISNGGEAVGGITGIIAEDAQISNCINNGSVQGKESVGGIVGLGNSGNITECTNNGKIYGEAIVGGIIGVLGISPSEEYVTSISKCSNYGYVKAEGGAAGICAALESETAIIEDSKNFGLIDAYQYSAGIVGSNSANVKNCNNIGEIFGNDIAAGIVAENRGTVLNCNNAGIFCDANGMDTSEVLGGVVGYNNGAVSYCSNIGDIPSSDGFGVGGVVGYSVGIVDNSYNTGEIFGTEVIGGVIGYNQGTIENCYNTGNASGSDRVGGIVGENNYNDGNGTVLNCHNVGEVLSSGYAFGGIAGYTEEKCIIENCYYLKNEGVSQNGIGELLVITSESVDGFSGYIIHPEDTAGVTNAQSAEQFASGEVAYLLNGSTSSEDNVWRQNIGVDLYPKFNGNVVYKVFTCNDQPGYSNSDVNVSEHHFNINGFCENCNGYETPFWNDAENCYEISNAGQLYWFAQEVNSGNNAINGALMNDIVVNENVLVDGELNADKNAVSKFRKWTPIGIAEAFYSGTFDGQNNTISGLYFNDVSARFVGLFGVSNGTIRNINLTDSYFCGDYYVGGIVANSAGTIERCCNECLIEGGAGVGGIVAVGESIIIINCENKGNICGDYYVGGIVAGGESIIIINCENKGNICGDYYVGGIVAGGESIIIINCENKGNICGDYYVGGILGYGDATIANCSNSGTISGATFEEVGYVGGIVGGGAVYVTNCFNSGNVTGGIAVGGIAGYTNGEISNCYNSGKIIGEYAAGGIAGANEEAIYNCYNCGNVKANFAVGSITGLTFESVLNCYYLEGSAVDNDGIIQNGIGNEASGSVTEDINGATTAKSAEQFASGEVAYLLNGSTSSEDNVWRQNLGTDRSPRFNGLIVYYDGTATYYNESIIKAWKSQIRFDTNEDGTFAGTFDYRVLATITSDDLMAVFGSEENAQEMIVEAGFVMTKGTDVSDFDYETAKNVVLGASSAYSKVSVQYISTSLDTDKSTSGAGDYVMSCIVENVPEADKNLCLATMAYIVYNDDNGNLCYMFYPAINAVCFEGLYNTYYPQAFPS